MLILDALTYQPRLKAGCQRSSRGALYELYFASEAEVECSLKGKSADAFQDREIVQTHLGFGFVLVG